jgi:hypothetical protein
VADRVVRFTAGFSECLDSLFPEERSPEGGPSATDFLLYELPRPVGGDFEGTTLPADEPPVRVWVGSGIFVRHLAVYGYIDDHGAVEVIWLLIG